MVDFNHQLLGAAEHTPHAPALPHMARRGQESHVVPPREGGWRGWHFRAHLVGFRRSEAVALQEERGLWEQFIQEHAGVALARMGRWDSEVAS